MKPRLLHGRCGEGERARAGADLGTTPPTVNSVEKAGSGSNALRRPNLIPFVLLGAFGLPGLRPGIRRDRQGVCRILAEVHES